MFHIKFWVMAPPEDLLLLTPSSHDVGVVIRHERRMGEGLRKTGVNTTR